MSTKSTLLLLEEDAFTAELLAGLLQSQFEIVHATNMAEVFYALNHSLPDVILLSLGNENTSSFDVCKKIRVKAETEFCPIIFLSDSATTEDLFSIYQAGGDDYLPRSLTKHEFCSRIKHTITQCSERNRLRVQLMEAYSVAMTAMSSAAEVGEILQFLRNSFACSDYKSLCQTVLQTISVFGLDGRVQVRGQQETASYNALGPCSQVEESVFATMLKEGRLVSFSKHCACSYEHVTLIVKNMPREDVDRYGRMSDNLALLCEAVNERVIALDKELYIAQQQTAYQQLVDVVNLSLVDMNQQLIAKLFKDLSQFNAEYHAQYKALLALPELQTPQINAIKALYARNQLEQKMAALMQELDFQPLDSKLAVTQAD